MENTAQEKPDRTPEKILAIGCLVTLCIILLVCAGSLTTIYGSEIPIVKNYFPTPVLTATAAPAILVPPPSKNNVSILKDDFTTNYHNWSAYYFFAKVEVKEGKLSLEAFEPDSIAVARCFCKAPADTPFTDRYYVQADVSTVPSTQESYGLVFGLTDEGDFYTFTINPALQEYFLTKSVPDGWVSLSSGSSAAIKAYPEMNTMSVYFDQGSIELYINGERVNVYKDENPINTGEIGMVAEDVGYKLIIDNLFAYNVK